MAVGGAVWAILDMGDQEPATDKRVDVTFAPTTNGFLIDGRF